MRFARFRLQPGRFRGAATLALTAALGASALGAALQPDRARAADFSVGDTAVVATDRLNLREEPGMDGEVLTVLTDGMTGEVTGGPETMDDYDWYEIETDEGTGWAASEFLAAPSSGDGDFAEGDPVVVFDGTLNLRAEAGLDAEVLDVMADGSAAAILSGPVIADDLAWYEIETEDYGDGWAAGDFLTLADDEQPSDAFPVDAILVVATDDGSNLNLREEASIDGTLIDKLPVGSQVVVLDGPTAAGGFSWYQLDTDLGTGWAAGDFLAYPADLIEVGDTVAVFDGTLNLRDAAGLDGEVIGKLPDGEVLEVTDGPEVVDGYTWFEVENEEFGPGWAAGDFLAVQSTDNGDDDPTPTPTATATATLTVTT